MKKFRKWIFLLLLLTVIPTWMLYTARESTISKSNNAKSIEPKPKLEIELPTGVKLIQGSNNQTYKSLVVTAYVPIDWAKHSQESYYKWISIISNIESPMVIYTDVIHQIEPYRINKPTLFIPTTMDSLRKREGWDERFTNAQHAIDPEGYIHQPNLYIVWDTKTRLVYEASEKYNYWGSEYFFWVDIGSFRTNDHLVHWPDPDRVEKAFQGENRAIYAAVYWPTGLMNLYRKDEGPFEPRFIEGTFFAGNKVAIKNLYHKYYELRREYQNKFFVGKDQSIMSSLVLLNKQDFLILNSTAIPCMDSWFFFQQYFASDKEARPECLDSRIVPTIYLDK